MGERVDWPPPPGYRRTAAWRRIADMPYLRDQVHVGVLADGRWFATTTAQRCGWAYPTEAEALAAAAAMRAEGIWEPTSPNPTQEPRN